MTRAAFPLSKPKDRNFRLPSYRCRVVRFRALDTAFRLLIAYHAAKEQYRAVLAIEHDRDMTVIAQHEFHGTHPGWHLLASCNSDGTPRGVMRFPGQRRMPRSRAVHRNTTFGIKTDYQALAKAVRFFRLHKARGPQGQLL
jgi:hypothetical protein